MKKSNFELVTQSTKLKLKTKPCLTRVEFDGTV